MCTVMRLVLSAQQHFYRGIPPSSPNSQRRPSLGGVALVFHDNELIDDLMRAFWVLNRPPTWQVGSGVRARNKFDRSPSCGRTKHKTAFVSETFVNRFLETAHLPAVGEAVATWTLERLWIRQVAMPRNSWRVRALSRKQPSMRLVTRSVPGLWTPRVVMQ